MDVRQALAEVGRDQQGLGTARQLRRSGASRSALSRALARGDVVRVLPTVYALRPLEPWPLHAVRRDAVAPELVQRVRAVLLSLGERATAAGPTAACLRGWGLLHEPVRTVHVVLPNGRRRARLRGVQSRQARRVGRELLRPVAGARPLWVTDPVGTVLDCCRRLPLLEAVVACDSALRSGQVTVEELDRAARRQRGTRRASRVRRALALCDPASGSVLESVLRVLMLEAGLRGFETQRVLHDARGRRLHRVDFCFPRERLVVEVDGAAWHPDAAVDRRLDNRLAAAGWRVLRFTWAEVVHDPQAVLDVLRAALAGTEDVHVGQAGARAAA